MTTPQAGVYALIHRPTQRVYVGSSANLPSRLASWRHVLRNGAGLPARLAALPRGTDDWEFKVIVDGSHMTVTEILNAEQQAITRIAEKAPERLLNASVAGRRESLTAFGKTQSIRAWAAELHLPKSTICMRLGRGLSPEEALAPTAPPPTKDNHYVTAAQVEQMVVEQSKVLVLDGNRVMSRTEAAEALGCSTHTLRERLRKYQNKDGTQATIQIGFLKERTEKYRHDLKPS